MAKTMMKPLGESIFKSQIFRNHTDIDICKRTNALLLRRRRTPIPLPPLSHLLHPPHHHLPIHHLNLHPNPPLHPLFRPRSPPLLPPMSSITPNSDSNPPTKSVRVVVKGRVQGVFYRNWTVENAIELGLRGWVRNRRDGSVEALFSGSSGKVQEMEQRCRRGPPAAMVTALEVSPSDEDPGAGFERRRTV